MAQRGLERRRHVRFPHRLGVNVSTPTASKEAAGAAPAPDDTRPIEIETLDISSGGAICHSMVLLPVMTRLQINLLLPRDDGRLLKPMTLRGCVVRAEPAPVSDLRGGFHIAMLFTEIDTRDQQLLDEFLERRDPGRQLAH